MRRVVLKSSQKSWPQQGSLRQIHFASPGHNLFVSCTPGLEHILSSELTELGISSHSVDKGGVNISGASAQDILDCHLYLGSASHVLLRCCAPFRARGFPELQRKVEKIDWAAMLDMKSKVRLDIRASARKSKLFHTGAIAERIGQVLGPLVGGAANIHTDEKSTEEPTLRLAVRIERDMVQLSLDTSETPLHRRGYRLQTAKAPLREDLAFALVYSTGIKPQYHRQREIDPFEATNEAPGAILDPFCGSGTIAIEGACMLAGLPPGRLRPAPLEGTRWYSPSKWKKMIEVSIKGCGEQVFVSASDRDAGACEATRANAERAGVSHLLDTRVCSFSCNPWLQNLGKIPTSILLTTNPPFGKRISKKTRPDRPLGGLLPLYQSFGRLVASLGASSTVTTSILAHDQVLARRTGIPDLKCSFVTRHGGLLVSSLVARAQ